MQLPDLELRLRPLKDPKLSAELMAKTESSESTDSLAGHDVESKSVPSESSRSSVYAVSSEENVPALTRMTYKIRDRKVEREDAKKVYKIAMERRLTSAHTENTRREIAKMIYHVDHLNQLRGLQREPTSTSCRE